MRIVCAIGLLGDVGVNGFNMKRERKGGGGMGKVKGKWEDVMVGLEDEEWMKLVVMYEESDVKGKGVFGKGGILGEGLKVVGEEKRLVE